MKKNSIDNGLWSRDFLLMCIANFLLYASVYAILPFLSVFAMGTYVYPAFLAGMLAVGPFHAWLADQFRRKHVLVYPFIVVILCTVGYLYASSATEFVLLSLLQGACFGLASAAGTTVSIDVVSSGHRTAANMAFATIGRLGVVAGLLLLVVWLGVLASRWELPALIVLSAVVGGVGVLLAACVYVPFRAPIGLKVCSFDRFLLGRAWLPALNVGLIGMAFMSATVYLLSQSASSKAVLFAWLPLLLLAGCVSGLVKMFVKLSHHCQRATGNTTFNTLLDGGLLGGIWLSMDVAKGQASWVLLALFLLSGILFICATHPYYKRKRVR